MVEPLAAQGLTDEELTSNLQLFFSIEEGMCTLPVVVQQPSTYVYPSVELGFGTELVDRHVGFKGIRTDIVPFESCFPYGVSEILITR